MSQQVFGDAKPAHDLLVEQANSPCGDSPHGQFFFPRNAQLAHHQHIATIGVSCEPGGQNAPGLCLIAKACISHDSQPTQGTMISEGKSLSLWILDINVYPRYTCTRGALQKHHRTGHHALTPVTIGQKASSSSRASVIVREEWHPKRLAVSGRRSSPGLPPTRTRAGRRAAPPVHGRGRAPVPCR